MAKGLTILRYTVIIEPGSGATVNDVDEALETALEDLGLEARTGKADEAERTLFVGDRDSLDKARD